MVDIRHLPDDFCVGHYVPQRDWHSEGYPDDGYTAFILDIKNKCQEAIQKAIELLQNSLSGFDAVTVVPSHQVGGQLSGIGLVASGLDGYRSSVVDATSCLQRHRTIQKLAEGGNREIQLHLDSIRVNNADLIDGKRVLLLDDIRTTGNSLKACKQLLQTASPKSVHPFAFGQCYGPDVCDPEGNYFHIDLSICEVYQHEMEWLQHQMDSLSQCEAEERGALDRLKCFALGE